IEAEAAFRSGDHARELNAFIVGIRSNMVKVGVPDGDISTYMQEKYGELNSSTLIIQQIMDEKYLAMFSHTETWNDARRFDYQYTDFVLPANANLGEFIRRLEYPDSEKSRNGSNVPAIEGLTEPVHWDE